MRAHRLTLHVLSSSAQCAVIRVGGELDHGGERLFLDTVGSCVDSGHRYVVLDLTTLTFCDSRGLNCLFAVRWLLRRQGGELLLAAVGRRVTYLLEQTGSTDVIATYRSVREALEHVPEPLRARWPPGAVPDAARPSRPDR
ncbi:anti-sigma factor antagonist [Streptomyces sp. WAC 06738]|uniref:STAS domain-containing protein n=1 Tax=Streptomyces sp. WAC 06738 TaxID=2203210 RepID=UPI000F6D822B|nr:STAS domain-containing protein [Streptomyces sp. WAC 06738]AZM47104.1 anti-sigma factor antagonist [Streptomyces sp. WAC 06738]